MMQRFPETFTNADKYILVMALAMSQIHGIRVYGHEDFRDSEDIYELIDDFGGNLPVLPDSEMKALRTKPAMVQSVQYGRNRQADRLTANGWQKAYMLAIKWCVWAECWEPMDYSGDDFWDYLFQYC